MTELMTKQVYNNISIKFLESAIKSHIDCVNGSKKRIEMLECEIEACKKRITEYEDEIRDFKLAIEKLKVA